MPASKHSQQQQQQQRVDMPLTDRPQSQRLSSSTLSGTAFHNPTTFSLARSDRHCCSSRSIAPGKVIIAKSDRVMNLVAPFFGITISLTRILE